MAETLSVRSFPLVLSLSRTRLWRHRRQRSPGDCLAPTFISCRLVDIAHRHHASASAIWRHLLPERLRTPRFPPTARHTATDHHPALPRPATRPLLGCYLSLGEASRFRPARPGQPTLRAFLRSTSPIRLSSAHPILSPESLCQAPFISFLGSPEWQSVGLHCLSPAPAI